MECRPLGPSFLDDARYEILHGRRRLFIIGFSRIVLLGDEVYVTMRPFKALRRCGPAVFRALKVMFEDLSMYRLYCQIEVENRVAQRWAEFFGFVRLPDLAGGRYQYLKEQGNG